MNGLRIEAIGGSTGMQRKLVALSSLARVHGVCMSLFSSPLNVGGRSWGDGSNEGAYEGQGSNEAARRTRHVVWRCEETCVGQRIRVEQQPSEQVLYSSKKLKRNPAFVDNGSRSVVLAGRGNFAVHG